MKKFMLFFVLFFLWIQISQAVFARKPNPNIIPLPTLTAPHTAQIDLSGFTGNVPLMGMGDVMVPFMVAS